MKTIVLLKKTLIAFSFPAAFLLLGTNETSAHVIQRPSGVQDTILVSRSQTNKRHKIRLYPNTDQNTILFSVSGESGKVYQLFLFDLDGKLTKQTQIKSKETTVLADIVKGNYTFEVFRNDERIENGLLVIK